jgi:hypothetical protein
MASIPRHGKPRKETTHPPIPNSTIGDAVRSRLANPRHTLLDRINPDTPAPRARQLHDAEQSGANQRTHISLIDRRHR